MANPSAAPDKLRIAIIVQGRFLAFETALALAGLGHEVRVFTNYPKWAAARFGLTSGMVASCWLQGIAHRFFLFLQRWTGWPVPEQWLTLWFARWAARTIKRSPWDIVQVWSGHGLETLLEGLSGDPVRIVVRGSAHIREQWSILKEEIDRSGVTTALPSDWMMTREEREYAAADRILVFSAFSKDSFIRRGVPAHKIGYIAPGLPDRFRPDSTALQRRKQRILSGEPLNILFCGTLSIQKGLFDLAVILRELSDPSRFRFRLAGTAEREARPLIERNGLAAHMIGKIPHDRMLSLYDNSDILVFPTVQDGYAYVLAEASAAGLIILTTPNCGGPELIEDGRSGWILPIRSPQAFIERLRWCETHRSALADMAGQDHPLLGVRSWTQHAQALIALAEEARRIRTGS